MSLRHDPSSTLELGWCLGRGLGQAAAAAAARVARDLKPCLYLCAKVFNALPKAPACWPCHAALCCAVLQHAALFTLAVHIPPSEATEATACCAVLCRAVLQHAAQFTSTLLSKVLAAPNVKLFNATAGEAE